ncbi:MAG: hypothetical protein EYC62_03620 [Alphaproteobacteria bacterium]|nr:MAG: hypothetical protein EYC62_03620 [Alphaproteobacteria bacterium]
MLITELTTNKIRPCNSVLFGPNAVLKIPNLACEKMGVDGRQETLIGFNEKDWEQFFGPLITEGLATQPAPLFQTLTSLLTPNQRVKISGAFGTLNNIIPDNNHVRWMPERTLSELAPLFYVISESKEALSDAKLAPLARSIQPLLSSDKIWWFLAAATIITSVLLLWGVARSVRANEIPKFPQPSHPVFPAPQDQKNIKPDAPKPTPSQWACNLRRLTNKTGRAR